MRIFFTPGSRSCKTTPSGAVAGVLLSVGLLVQSSIAASTVTLIADFQGTSPGQNTPWTSVIQLRPNLTYSGFVTGSGAVGRSTNNAFAFNINAPAGTYSTLAEAILENEYAGMTLSPQPGHPLNLRKQEVSFSIQRASWYAPRRYAVLSSLTGLSSSSQALFITPGLESGDFTNREFRFFLPDEIAFEEITNPVEFRLFAFDAQYNHETRLTSFTITQYPGPTYVLTTNAGPGGSIFPPAGSRILRGGETIELRATPESGKRFKGWQGPVAPGRTAIRTVVLNGDTSVTALFEPTPERKMFLGMNLTGVAD